MGDLEDFRVELGPKQIILINTITQHTILGSIALISAQIYLFIFLIHMFIQNDFISNLLLTSYRPFDRILQMFCIYISLNFAHDIYRKCCQKMHNQCRKGMENIAKTKIKKRLIEKNDDL